MGAYSDAKQSAAILMNALVDRRSRLVRFSDLMSLDDALRRLEFKLIQKQQYGPPGGWQLFYQSGRLLVRIKTRGDAQGFRANQPHLSVSLNDGQGLDWQNDQAKIGAGGQIEPKAMTTPEQFKPIDFQGNPQRFVVILGGQYDGPGPNAWANRTHFQFPPGFNFSGAEGL